MTDKHESHEDRLIDLALQEKAGGNTPPDLSDKILRETKRPASAATTALKARTNWQSIVPFAAAASLLIMFSIIAVVSTPSVTMPTAGNDTDQRPTFELSDLERHQHLIGQLERFNSLMEEGRYTEGAVIASQARSIDPESPVTQNMLWRARLALRRSGFLAMNGSGSAYAEWNIGLPGAIHDEELYWRGFLELDEVDKGYAAPTLTSPIPQLLLDPNDRTALPEAGSYDRDHLDSFVESRLSSQLDGQRPFVTSVIPIVDDSASMGTRGVETDGEDLATPNARGRTGDWPRAVGGVSIRTDVEDLLGEFDEEEGRFLGLLERERRRFTDKLHFQVEEGLKASRAMMATDKESALCDLKLLLEAVERAEGLDDQTRAQLRDKVEPAIPAAVLREISPSEARALAEQNGAEAQQRLLVREAGRRRENIQLLAETITLLKRESEAIERAAAEAAKEKVEKTWRRSSATPNASRLIIGEKDELISEGLQVNVVIDGFRARVLLDYYYYNDRDQQLEGTFKLRLPNDASLFYFAFGETKYDFRPQVDKLASNGFLDAELVRASGTSPEDILQARRESWPGVKEARVVPREKASRAYGDTVRKQVDPALVEWSGAGLFNASVFPLMPNKLHRIVIGYDVTLQHDGDDWTYSLDLPEDRNECSVDLSIAALAGAAETVTPAAKPFNHNGRNFYHFKSPNEDTISMRLPDPGVTLLRGADASGDYFAVEIEPPLPNEGLLAGSPNAVFLLDTSLSSSPENFNVWLDLLAATLEKNRDSIESFAVLMFNVEAHWWQDRFAANTPENVAAFIEYAQTLALEGATDLGTALREAAQPSLRISGEYEPPDVFLLSDGAVTWGETNLHALAKPLNSGSVGALFAYQTGAAGTATNVLEHLTRESGGAVFSVTSAEEVATAATAHRKRPWQLLGIAADGCSDLLAAGRPKTVYPGQRLLVVGRGEPKEGSDIVVHVRRGDERRELRIAPRRIVASELTPRVYGQVAVEQLENLYEATVDTSVAYARHFRVPGQTCSLLMLESEEDYERFNIKPEEDAFIVKSTPALDEIQSALDEFASRLDDAKASLTHWLEKLREVEGVELELSTALNKAVERMPREAFDVDVPRLKCEARLKSNLPRKFHQVLKDKPADQPLDYDVISAEAQRRHESLGTADGIKALSSLVEDNPGDLVLARDVAFTAMSWDAGGQAYSLLRRVARARPYEPQVYLAIARCLTDLQKTDLAMIYYEVALAGNWDDRVGDFKRIAGVEYVRLLQQIEAGELACHSRDFAAARLATLSSQTDELGADLLVTIMWNTDRTDVDLHVTEPSGEVCSYQHTETKAGGEITTDVTQGYGPEMYVLRSAPDGKYDVSVKYFRPDANRSSTRTKVYATIIQNFGTPQETVSARTVMLDKADEMHSVLKLTLRE